jgi:hypothetical protein
VHYIIKTPANPATIPAPITPTSILPALPVLSGGVEPDGVIAGVVTFTVGETIALEFAGTFDGRSALDDTALADEIGASDGTATCKKFSTYLAASS